MKLSIAFGISLVAAALAMPQLSPLHKRTMQQHKRITGGDFVLDNEFTFVASLLFSEGAKLSSFCTGVIISDEYIVTAADCLHKNGGMSKPYSSFHVGYGRVYANNQRAVSITKAIEHPDFNTKTFENNIAVIKVEKMVFEGTGVAAAKLYKGALKPGMAATTIGWGKIDDVFGGSESLNLKMAGVYIGEDNVCKAYDSSYMSGKFTSNNGATTCIDDSKSTGNGPCDGDFGGPFVITVGEEDQVAGIYSYGGGPEGNAECAANGGFNFYENLYKQLSFIRSETGLSL